MSAPFYVCNKEEQCAMIWFWGAEGVPVYQMLSCGKVCTNGRSCSKMVAQVSQMQNSHHPHPLHRKTLNESKPRFWMINRWRHKVAHHTTISHGFTQGIIYDQLGYHNVWTRSVPKQLTGEQKHNSLTICQGLLNCYHNEGDIFQDAFSLGMRHGSTTVLQKAHINAWNGKIWHCQSKRSLKLNHWQEKWCWLFSEMNMGQLLITTKRVTQQ